LVKWLGFSSSFSSDEPRKSVARSHVPAGMDSDSDDDAQLDSEVQMVDNPDPPPTPEIITVDSG